MAKSDNQKLKIFYILEHLEKFSHEQNPVKTAELISMLEPGNSSGMFEVAFTVSIFSAADALTANRETDEKARIRHNKTEIHFFIIYPPFVFNYIIVNFYYIS